MKRTKLWLLSLLTLAIALVSSGCAALNNLLGMNPSTESSSSQTTSDSSVDVSSTEEESSKASESESEAVSESETESEAVSESETESETVSEDESESEDSSEAELEPTYYVKEYYLEQDDGSYTLAGQADAVFEHEKDKLVMPGDEVYCDQRLYYGYVFDEENENNVVQAIVSADEITTLKRYYKKVETTVEPTDSAAWGTVSEESLYAYARYYVNGGDHHTGHGTKIAYVLDEDSTLGQNMQSLKMVELSEENPVGDRTEGSYYMLDIYLDVMSVQTHQFMLLPMFDKETYETNWSDDAVVKFDVYFTYEGYDPENPDCEQVRTFYTNGGYARTENVNTWYTLEVPLKNLLTNWDDIFDHPVEQDYNGTEMALFSLRGYVGTTPPAEVAKPTFWIGNFSIEEPTLEEETEWVWNKIDADKRGAAYVCNGKISGDWGTVAYLDEYQGATGVYKITSTHNQIQHNGIYIAPSHDKAYYEAILAEDPEAKLAVDMYWDEIIGDPTLSTNDTWDKNVGAYEAGKWHTFDMSLQTLVNNWDILGDGGDAQGSIIIALGLSGNESNYSFYLSNMRIDTVYDHPNAEADSNVFSKLTMSCIGDSITCIAEDQKYTPLLKEELGLRECYNYGVSGSTIAKSGTRSCITERYDAVAPQSNIISVLAGVNDCDTGVELGTINDTDNTTFYGALNVLVKGLKENHPNAFIFFMTPYKYINETASAKLEAYANAIKEVCALNNIPVLDLFNEGNFDYTNSEYTADGLHPTAKFYEEFTVPQIAEYLRANYPQDAE